MKYDKVLQKTQEKVLKKTQENFLSIYEKLLYVEVVALGDASKLKYGRDVQCSIKQTCNA